MLMILIVALLSSALFYIGSRALITRPLWSRYPRPIAVFMDCAACTGFWHGCWLSLALDARTEALGLPATHPYLGEIVFGLISLVLTPIVAGYMQRGLDSLGSAVSEEWENVNQREDTSE